MEVWEGEGGGLVERGWRGQHPRVQRCRALVLLPPQLHDKQGVDTHDVRAWRIAGMWIGAVSR